MADADLGVHLFVSATALVRAVETHIQQRYGLSTGRFAVLLALSAAPGGQRTPSALADLLAVSRPTITGIVDGLERAGLVRRSADRTNRRNQPVAVTAQGLRLVRTIAPDHFGRFAKVVERLPAADRATLPRAPGLLEAFSALLLEGIADPSRGEPC